MALGRQKPGFPASRHQMDQLLDLVVQAGHCDWRDARGPLGLTQAQAKGRFTGDEAQELIDRLLEAEHQADLAPGARTAEAGPGPDSAPPARTQRAAPSARTTTMARRRGEQAQLLRKVPDDLLAAELQRRGWAVIQP